MAIKTLNNLLKFASQEKAEKMIIASNDTDLSCFMQLPLGEEATFSLPKKISNNLLASFRDLLKIAPEELTKGKYFKLQDKDYNLNFYLSILSGKNGEKIIMSLVKPKKEKINFNQLGWQSDTKNEVKNILSKKKGLVIIASEEQQGKGTTLHSFLSLLNKSEKNIYLMNSGPNEELDGIYQINNQADNWERLLKYDTDVIAVEADTDTNTLKYAIKAANTGRLVIVSLRAVNSLEALFRLLSLSLPISLITDNLKLIVAQKLVKLKRTNNGNKTKNKRQKIALFETLKLDKNTKKFITDNQAKISSKEFWQELSRLSLQNTYQPFIIDEKKKKKDGLI